MRDDDTGRRATGMIAAYGSAAEDEAMRRSRIALSERRAVYWRDVAREILWRKHEAYGAKSPIGCTSTTPSE